MIILFSRDFKKVIYALFQLHKCKIKRWQFETIILIWITNNQPYIQSYINNQRPSPLITPLTSLNFHEATPTAIYADFPLFVCMRKGIFSRYMPLQPKGIYEIKTNF